MTRTDQLLKAAIEANGARGPNSSGEFSICCPYCELKTGEVDRKHKMQLSPTKGAYYCYRCATGGRAAIAEILDVAVDPNIVEVKPDLDPWPEQAQRLDVKSIAHKPYVDYLKNRNLLDESCKAGVHVCTTGYYAGRLLFPHNGLPIPPGPGSSRPEQERGLTYLGFSARTIHKGVEPKYLYPRGMNRRGSLWGQAKPWTPDLFIVEGVLDAVALWPDAVATFGKNVTEEQLDIIERRGAWGEHIIVALDGDAWEECASLCMRLVLRGCKNVTWARLPPGTDPGSLKGLVRNFIVTPYF